MILDDDREWSLECKLATRKNVTSDGTFGCTFSGQISELRKGRLVYDKISRSFSAFYYTVKNELKLKAQFAMDQVYVDKLKCINGRNYFIMVGRPKTMEIRIVDLNKSNKTQLHQLLISEVGARKGSNSFTPPISLLAEVEAANPSHKIRCRGSRAASNSNFQHYEYKQLKNKIWRQRPASEPDANSSPSGNHEIQKTVTLTTTPIASDLAANEESVNSSGILTDQRQQHESVTPSIPVKSELSTNTQIGVVSVTEADSQHHESETVTPSIPVKSELSENDQIDVVSVTAADGQQQEGESNFPLPFVEDVVAFVDRRINELLQMCTANGEVRERREHLMLRTISGEICDFLRGLVPMGFSHYALLPENAQNGNLTNRHPKIDERALTKELNAWFLLHNEQQLRTFVTVHALVISICGDFVRYQIELERQRQSAEAVLQMDTEIGQQPPNKRART